MFGNKNKLLQIFTKCKIDGQFTEFDKIDIVNLFNEFYKSDQVFKFKKDIGFFCFKTKYQDNDSVGIVFVIKSESSSKTNEMITEVLGYVEKLLFPLDYTYFYRNIEGIEKDCSILMIIRKIRENDLI